MSKAVASSRAAQVGRVGADVHQPDQGVPPEPGRRRDHRVESDAMELTGEIQPSQRMVRPGMSLTTSGTLVRGNRMFHTCYWSSGDAWMTSTEQSTS